MSQHDPKLVDELLAKIDAYMDPLGGSRELLELEKARKALRPAPPKPMEWWFNVYNDGDAFVYFTPQQAKDNLSEDGKTMHVREVMPNDDKPKLWMPEWKDLDSTCGEVFNYEKGSYIFKGTYEKLRKKLMSLDK